MNRLNYAESSYTYFFRVFIFFIIIGLIPTY